MLNLIGERYERPSLKHSLDRINCNGNYEPGNVRWATATQQANNTRWNHQILYDGRVQTMAEWGRRTGLDRGWSTTDALTTPSHRPLYTFQGLSLPLCEWARRTGVSAPLILGRIKRLGWSLERALSTPTGKQRRPARSPL